jgi:deoxyguanosine kinase
MLIVIEGCVGVGKSTVAEGLAAHRGSKALLENFEANPFLRAFYKDPIEYATETEFAFLLLHFHQLKNHAVASTESEVIADFHLGKDLIYAELNLKDERAKSLFAQLYDLCVDETPKPALMIFLSATTDLLIRRIRARNREFELDINPEYYASVNQAYEQYFEQFAGRKLRLSMETWDFVKEPVLYQKLASLIDGELFSRE